MKKTIYIFIFTLLLFSCNNNDLTKIENSDLIGKWNWRSTKGGIGGHINDTPQTTGKTIHLILSSDYTFSVIENGDTIADGTYLLTTRKSIYNGEMERFIDYVEKDNSKRFWSGIITTYKTNKLDILSNFYDGVGSEFVRIE